jgi:hypothetical protein
MPRIRCLLLLAGILAVALGSGSGCGKRKAKIQGTVLKDGKPIQVSKTGHVAVTLIPVVKEGEDFTTYPARADEQGNFETAVPIPAGKYKIAVQQFDPTPQVDALKGAFSPNSTKIVRDIDGKTPLKIDIAKPEG